MSRRTTATAVVTTDRYGFRAYVWADGVHIARDGYGRMRWSLWRPEERNDTACSYYTTTLADAIGNI